MADVGPPPVKAQVAEAVANLRRAELLPNLGADLGPMRARLQGFAATLHANAALVEEIVDLVAAFQPVEEVLRTRRAEMEAAPARELDGKRADLFEDERRRAAAEVEAGLAARKAAVATEQARLEEELTTAEQVIDLAKQKGAEARSARDKLRASRDELREALQDELRKVSAELDDVPVEAEQDAGLIARRIGERLRARGADVELAPDPAPPWTRVERRTRSPGRPWSDYPEVLQASAKRSGFLPETLVVADVAVRSGAAVTLPEAVAGVFAGCHAVAMAEGEVVRQVLDPSMIALDDLWRTPNTRSPTAFARAWTAAKGDPNRFRVVLLDGLGRTLMDLWLPSLIEVLCGAVRPQNLLVFASLEADVVDAARCRRSLAELLVPLAPERQPGLAAADRARIAQKPPQTAWFDASTVPRPDAADVVDVTDSASIDLRRAADILRAAWPLYTTVEPARVARAFWENNGVDAYGAVLVAGRQWLSRISKGWEG
ncbi:hypothetical protein [Acuticoccus sp.]|uniref:hypothetical protein n=1 Tax=Acuticoccus sp. TaxID=1904378 RepID=UPI003B51DEFB